MLVQNLLLVLVSGLRSMLEDFHVLPLSHLRTHSVQRRDVQQETHKEKLVSFDALHRSEVTTQR